ncbi:MAG: hypothetical protein ACR2N1_16710 [Rubripirellula sp.]
MDQLHLFACLLTFSLPGNHLLATGQPSPVSLFDIDLGHRRLGFDSMFRNIHGNLSRDAFGIFNSPSHW